MDFSGKTAIVTGGTAGVGRAVSEALAGAGAQVFAAARNEPRLAFQNKAIQFIRADVADRDQIEHIVERAVSETGRLDCAVNCAAYEGEFHPLDRYPDDDFLKVMRVNLFGQFWLLKCQLRAMLDQGAGAIVNLSSIAGLKGVPHASAYVASKHAVIGLTRSAALEVAGKGVRVNAICPALVDTDMAGRLSDKTGLTIAELTALNPAGRMALTGEVASAILWLLSDAASFVNGQTISVDAGQSIS